MRAPLLLALLTVAPLFAGCLAEVESDLDALVYEPLPPPPDPPAEGLDVHGLSVKRRDVTFEHLDLALPSFDGVELEVDVWLPKLEPVTVSPLAVNATDPVNGTSDGANATLPPPPPLLPDRFPVVLVLSPYFEGVKRPEFDDLPLDPFYFLILNELVPRGYAVALVDLRGTASSDGCIDLGGAREQRDAFEVVEFLGTQEWSNGKVGMIGGSYDGWTQQQAAVMAPPHLAAIVPIAPVADWYHVVGKGGAKFAGWTPGAWLGYNGAIGFPLPPLWASNGQEDPRFRRADDQACFVTNGLGSNDPTGDYNAWMRERDLRPRAAEAKAPMFYVHGFQDINARPDHIDPWYIGYGGPKRAFLFQADHFTGAFAEGTGRGDYWWVNVVQWFDHHLLGIANGANATYGQVEVQDTRGRWRHEPTWPPADAAPTDLPLGPGTIEVAGAVPEASPAPGALSLDVLPEAGSETWRDNPYEDGGQIGEKTGTLGSGSTPTRLVYVSPVLAGDIHYAGRAEVRAFVETDRPNTLLVVRLYEVLPDGSWVLVNRGVQSLRHRDGLEDPQPAAPAAVYEVTAAMQPNDHVFRAGHAIGLVITSSDASYVISSGTTATNGIHYGGAEPSALVLPVIHRDAFFATTWGAAQPAWLGPNAWGVPS